MSPAERLLGFIADHTGLCWLTLDLWWCGIGGREYFPIRRCSRCGYCGKVE